MSQIKGSKAVRWDIEKRLEFIEFYLDVAGAIDQSHEMPVIVSNHTAFDLALAEATS